MFASRFAELNRPTHQWGQGVRTKAAKQHHQRCQCAACIDAMIATVAANTIPSVKPRNSTHSNNRSQSERQRPTKTSIPVPNPQTNTKPTSQPTPPVGTPSQPQKPNPQQLRTSVPYTPLLDLDLTPPKPPVAAGEIILVSDLTMYEYTVVMPDTTLASSIHVYTTTSPPAPGAQSQKPLARMLHITAHTATPTAWAFNASVSIEADANTSDMVFAYDKSTQKLSISLPRLTPTPRRVHVTVK
ncbi:hypothetical protein BASA50_002566 [Batrachochytrium salamandrivorans]|uniref:Uncharacterized protein n=1 Tax=Batrachochytrium salamandrivorans TaxID=1357716 RepID=A0ABQ8FM83_9FUNG|nr:hypothetical protein BASA50_002566 [Batrachochytrium salamandrivorans]KAH9250225.1 hypothetical protein BASA81_011968 [Batrachochytrium salamandrivorans]KAH9266029.1 hypothetical protein BASA84_001297 [Batrachochytrium salamandrivorans]